MDDPFTLSRFVAAQAPVYAAALDELRRGQKESHWMWFIFPQLSGLGNSPTARRFALSGPEEARAFLDHAILGPRLIACTQAVNAHRNRTARQMFGSPDDLKLRSSMTLFQIVAADPAPFQTALDRYFDGKPDPLTLERLSGR